MEEKKVRNLRPEEIECRVGKITDRGVTLLLYKSARVDQAILDETFGIFGWQRRHEKIGDGLFCVISVWDEEKKEWIQKEDVGTESDYESAKGAASDSFKRAGVNLGIGRELYTAPVIFLPADKVHVTEKSGKKYVNDRFSVKSVTISGDKVIKDLVIVNQRRETVFIYHRTEDPCMFTGEEMQLLYQELERTGVSEQSLFKRYQIHSIEEMNRDIYERALSGLKKTRNAA